MHWVILLGIIAIIYSTGLHTPIAGFIQRMILSTGIITPELKYTGNWTQKINYDLKIKHLRSREIINLNNYRGKVLFINFWATWCPPCIAEMPDIQSLYEKVGDEDIAFFMISVDVRVEKAKKFVEKKDFTFPVYQLASNLPSPFEARSIPTTYVIDQNGKIAVHKIGMASYDNEKFIAFLKTLAK